MKRFFLILVTILTAISTLCSNQLLAQSNESNNNESKSNESKSNGTLEIIAIYEPDFVVFRPAEGKRIKTYSVFFNSDTKSFKALHTKALYIDIEQVDGKMQSTCTDKSEIRAMNFNIPSSESFFKALKIKFIVDGEEMYYNIEKSEWE